MVPTMTVRRLLHRLRMLRHHCRRPWDPELGEVWPCLVCKTEWEAIPVGPAPIDGDKVMWRRRGGRR